MAGEITFSKEQLRKLAEQFSEASTKAHKLQTEAYVAGMEVKRLADRIRAEYNGLRYNDKTIASDVTIGDVLIQRGSGNEDVSVTKVQVL